EDFVSVLERLKSCSKLQNIEFKLHQCFNLTDNSIHKFSEFISSLSGLQTLRLDLNEIKALARRIIAPIGNLQNNDLMHIPELTKFSLLSIYYITEAIANLQSLKSMSLNFCDIQGNLDKAINDLLA